MIALPLVTRELQAEARRAFSYWLRVLGAGSVVAAFAVTSLSLQVSPGQHGAALFRSLNTALALAIWILVPVLTADAISREKREGTLGLLFLTPLSARDIIVGKAVTHGLRALTLILAALPILGLPVILGGIGWKWAVYSIASHLSALLLALAAGLIASVRNTEWTRSLVTAELLSGLFALAFGAFGFIGFLSDWRILGVILILVLLGRPPLGPRQTLFGQVPPRIHYVGSEPRWVASPPATQGIPRLRSNASLIVAAALILGFLTWRWLGLGQLIVALTLFLLTLDRSARHLKETWQQDLGAPAQPQWVKLFSDSEFWQTLFRWNKSRTLDRNPIAWLQEYSWTARLTKWGWCVVILLGELATGLTGAGFGYSQKRLTVLLMLGMAFTASGSFRRERETGALELLLVTPLQARHLLGGRLWGIWCHFFPAMAVLLVCWLMVPYARAWDHRLWVYGAVSTFLLLPVIGLYFSLLDRHFLVAWLSTIVLGLLLPGAVMVILSQTPAAHASRTLWTIQAMIAGYAGWRVYQILHRRQFVFHQA